MRIKRTLGVIAAATLIMVTGCGNAVDENVEKENTPAQESSVPVEPTESASDEQIEEPAAEADSDYRVVFGGPYGQISLFVPDGWEYIVCPVDDDQMSYGLYGFILKPLEASEGQIELFCSDSFGVCGTGLKQEEITLAGETAHIGTYDEHEHWDFITFGSDSPQIVAQSIGCDGWTDGMWDEAMTILDKDVRLTDKQYKDLTSNMSKKERREFDRRQDQLRRDREDDRLDAWLVRTIALRFGENIAPECGTIEAHNQVINEYCEVWYGKFGTPLSEKVIADIIKNEPPKILLIHSGTVNRYWTYIKKISKEAPDLNKESQ